MKKYIGVLLIATVMLPTAAAAQEKPNLRRGARQRQAGAAAARRSDAAPGRWQADFSGVWFEGPTGKANAWSVDREQGLRKTRSRCSRGPQTKRNAMTRVELELSSASVNCMPVGTPGMFTENAFAHQIIMKPGLLVHLVEMNNRWHVIHTDGRPHKPKEELEPLFYGDQTARWEGDMLVIDSISIDDTCADSGRVVPQRRAARDRTAPSAVGELSRVSAHDRGPEGADQALDVTLEHLYALGQ